MDAYKWVATSSSLLTSPFAPKYQSIGHLCLKCVHENIYMLFLKKGPFIFHSFHMKNDSDKLKVKNVNDLLKCEGWKTQQIHVVFQSEKNKKKLQKELEKQEENERNHTRNFKFKNIFLLKK